MATRPGSVTHEEPHRISPTTGGTVARIGNTGNSPEIGGFATRGYEKNATGGGTNLDDS